jgi:ketosteroid isomerase-like protein
MVRVMPAPATPGSRAQQLDDAYAALDRGDLGPFEALFTADAQWLAVPGSGPDGATPT